MTHRSKDWSDPKAARRAALIEETQRRVAETQHTIARTRTMIDRTREEARRSGRPETRGRTGPNSERGQSK